MKEIRNYIVRNVISGISLTMSVADLNIEFDRYQLTELSVNLHYSTVEFGLHLLVLRIWLCRLSTSRLRSPTVIVR